MPLDSTTDPYTGRVSSSSIYITAQHCEFVVQNVSVASSGSGVSKGALQRFAVHVKLLHPHAVVTVDGTVYLTP